MNYSPYIHHYFVISIKIVMSQFYLVSWQSVKWLFVKGISSPQITTSITLFNPFKYDLRYNICLVFQNYFLQKNTTRPSMSLALRYHEPRDGEEPYFKAILLVQIFNKSWVLLLCLVPQHEIICITSLLK